MTVFPKIVSRCLYLPPEVDQPLAGVCFISENITCIPTRYGFYDHDNMCLTQRESITYIRAHSYLVGARVVFFEIRDTRYGELNE